MVRERAATTLRRLGLGEPPRVWLVVARDGRDWVSKQAGFGGGGGATSGRSELAKEASILAQLASPFWVRSLGLTEDGETLWLNYVRGVDGRGLLRDLAWRGEALGPRTVATLGRALAEGLAALHGLGWAHLRVCPEHILLSTDGSIRICSLGGAQELGALRDNGSLADAYAAPELTSKGPVDGRADVYSAGVVLYELLTGVRPPLWGASAAVPPPSSVRSDIHPEVDPPIMEALRRDPGSRPTAAAWALSWRRWTSAPAELSKYVEQAYRAVAIVVDEPEPELINTEPSIEPSSLEESHDPTRVDVRPPSVDDGVAILRTTLDADSPDDMLTQAGEPPALPTFPGMETPPPTSPTRSLVSPDLTQGVDRTTVGTAVAVGVAVVALCFSLLPPPTSSAPAAGPGTDEKAVVSVEARAKAESPSPESETAAVQVLPLEEAEPEPPSDPQTDPRTGRTEPAPAPTQARTGGRRKGPRLSISAPGARIRGPGVEGPSPQESPVLDVGATLFRVVKGAVETVVRVVRNEDGLRVTVASPRGTHLLAQCGALPERFTPVVGLQLDRPIECALRVQGAPSAQLKLTLRRKDR